MALGFVLDENQRGLLWRAVIRHNQIGLHVLDVVRVGDPPDLPLGSMDADILVWCEREDRILVSFDKSTMAGHLASHLQAGRRSPGIFMLRRGSHLPDIVDTSRWSRMPATPGNGKIGLSSSPTDPRGFKSGIA